MIFHAKGPPCPLPHIYHCYISYIIYHCCILVGTNNAATRWWQSLRNSPLPFLLSPTPLAFVIHPASSLYNIMIYIYTYTCISRTYPLFLLHPFHSPLRTVLRCEVLLDSPELALRLQILAKDSRSWATQASLAPWRRCWWKLETYVEAKLVIYTLYIYIYIHTIYIYILYIYYIYIYIYCIYIYNINLYVVCFETTHWEWRVEWLNVYRRHIFGTYWEDILGKTWDYHRMTWPNLEKNMFIVLEI